MKITLSNEKEIELKINRVLGFLDFFKKDFDFEEIFKSLKSIPADLKNRESQYLHQKKEEWSLLTFLDVVFLYRVDAVQIQKLTKNKLEKFWLVGFCLDPDIFKKFSTYYEHAIMRRTINDKTNNTIQKEEINIEYHSGKAYLTFEQKKIRVVKKDLRKKMYIEFNFKELSSKLIRLNNKLKADAETPTLE